MIDVVEMNGYVRFRELSGIAIGVRGFVGAIINFLEFGDIPNWSFRWHF